MERGQLGRLRRGDADGSLPESRALTGLRGIAAFLVMAHHLYLRIGLDQHIPMLQWLLRKGYLGVDLFFVLSGFVISMVYGRWFQAEPPATLRDYLRFIIRRVARIWPLHVAVLGVLLALNAVHGGPDWGLRIIVENLTMVQGWGHSTEINAPAWSISTEFAAYLLFPVLALVVLRGRWRPVLAVVGVAVLLGAAMYFSPPIGILRRGRLDIYFNYSPLPVMRCVAGFVFGMLTWRLGQVAWVRRVAAVPWVGPAALALMLGMMLGRVNDVLTFLVFPVVVLGMHHGRGPVQRALGGSPLHRLGVLSYSIYLVHFSLLVWFPFGLGQMRFMLPAYVGATLLLAVAAHVLVEQPGRVVVRAVGERLLRLVWRGEGRGEGRPLQDRTP